MNTFESRLASMRFTQEEIERYEERVAIRIFCGCIERQEAEEKTIMEACQERAERG